jgi:hypothetical protein
MINLSAPGAGMNHPSRGTPSLDGKVTFSYARPSSEGRCSTGERAV